MTAPPPAGLDRWTWHPFVLAMLVAAAWLYFRGAWRLARRGERSAVRASSLAAFAAGWTALLAALLSPIDFWSAVRFSVHMTQHEILMLVAAPLLVLARPLSIMLWAFDERGRLAIGAAVRWPPIAAAWRAITGPLAVFALHAAALWIWHAPPLYQAALASDAVHAIQHACFLGTACLFWWALVHGRYGRLGYGLAVAYVFATSLHANVLGALLTFSPWVWYPVYAVRASGADPLADQQLAGLIMWIPFGAVFVVLGLALFAAWLGEAERRVTLLEAGMSAPRRKRADAQTTLDGKLDVDRLSPAADAEGLGL